MIRPCHRSSVRRFWNQDSVFSTLDEVCGEGQSLPRTHLRSVNALAEATGRPDRFVGLHFFYHPAKNRLIEVIPAETTSKDTLIEPFSIVERLEKW